MKVEKNNLKSVLIDFLRFGIWQIQNDTPVPRFGCPFCKEK